VEGLLAQRYRLETVVGSGGMGTVWRAHDELLDRPAAIKEVRYSTQLSDAERKELTTRAVAEARHAARLEHPRIVPIYDVLIHDGRPWIVMRLITGRSLEQHVLANTRLPDAEVERIARGLLQALAAAHRGGVLHRDVKPSNVLIDDDGEPMLTDFSIARAIGQGNATNTGIVMGTPGYIAPERLITGTTGPEADLFGLGATLFFAAEGRAPFAHEDVMAGAFAAAIHPHPRPEHAGPELTRLIDGLLEKDPRQRLSIAAAQALLDPGADSPVPAPPPALSTSDNVAPANFAESAPTPELALAAATPDLAGRFAVGRVESAAMSRIAPVEPIADDVETDAEPGRWKSRLALLAGAVLLLAGSTAVIAQVVGAGTDRAGPSATTSASPTPGLPTPSSAPSATPAVSPSPTMSSAGPTTTKSPPSNAFFSPQLKAFGSGFQPGWHCESRHEDPARAKDASVCGLSGAPVPGMTKPASRIVDATFELFAPGTADQYMGCTPAYVIPGMPVGKVDLPGTSGNRAGFYCETTGELTQNGTAIGYCTYVMWTSGANDLLGLLDTCFRFSDEGDQTRPTMAVLEYLRSIWNQRA
jgi:eukaryotic-like serine/threonine-protein kinase